MRQFFRSSNLTTDVYIYSTRRFCATGAIPAASVWLVKNHPEEHIFHGSMMLDAYLRRYGNTTITVCANLHSSNSFAKLHDSFQKKSSSGEVYCFLEGMHWDKGHVFGLETNEARFLSNLLFCCIHLSYFKNNVHDPRSYEWLLFFHAIMFLLNISQWSLVFKQISNNIYSEFSFLDKLKLKSLSYQVSKASLNTKARFTNELRIDHEKFFQILNEHLIFLWAIFYKVYKHGRLLLPEAGLPSENNIKLEDSYEVLNEAQIYVMRYQSNLARRAFAPFVLLVNASCRVGSCISKEGCALNLSTKL